MSKKKQVTFQPNVPGKFIPRENPPVAVASSLGSVDLRLNSRMAEILASSSPIKADENLDDRVHCSSTELPMNETSRAQSKVLRRRIVTMLETLRRRGTNSNLNSTQTEPTTQPITFGQLRKATTEQQQQTTMTTADSTVEQEELIVKNSLTVDEIVAQYYSKLQLTNSPGISSLSTPTRPRPPPPSYSSSVAANPKTVFIRPPVPSVQPVPPPPSTVLGQFFSTNRVAPPPRYEKNRSTLTSSIDDVRVERIPTPTPIVAVPTTSTGFDREFSRLLYGKEIGRSRNQRPKRKAFSDPVKKSVEEAGRSIEKEKSRRRLTTHLNRTDTVREEEETTSSESTEIDCRNSKSIRRSSRMTIVPANPMLKTRIPSFLRNYCDENSANDFRSQWNFYSFNELESFDAMLTKLHKDENLKLVQIYENYRVALTKLRDEVDDSITTTAL